MSKSKIGLIVAAALTTLGAIATVIFLLVPKGHTEIWTTDRPVSNWTSVTDQPVEWTTESVTEKPVTEEPAELNSFFEEMYLNMNNQVDPCEDFYEYACGMFRYRKPSRTDKSPVNYYLLEYEKIRNKTIEILEGDSLNDKGTSLQYLKRVWDSCVNDETDTDSHLPILMKYLEELDNLETWEEKLAMVTKDGYNVFFTIKGEHHPKATLAFRLSIDRPKLEYVELFDITSDMSNPVLTFYAKMLKLFQNNDPEKMDYSLALEMMEFESWMSTNATSMSEKAQRPWDFSIPMHLKTVEEVSSIKWSSIMGILVNTSVNRFEDITVHDLKYLKQFKSIIESKDESFISNYIKMSIVRQSCFMLGKECRSLEKIFLFDVNQLNQEFEKQNCFDKINEQLEPLMFEAYGWPWKSHEEAREVINKMLAQLEVRVRNFWWMGEKTMKEALEKIRTLKYRFSIELQSPDWMNWIGRRDEMYSEVPFFNSRGVDFFTHHWNLSRYIKQKQLRRTTYMMTEDDPWSISLFSSTPKMYPLKNQLLVPAMVLQGHFFSEEYPPEIKYGLFGSLMGHALIHSVDSLSQRYHEANAESFWTVEARDKFDTKMKCLVEAYEKEKININGRDYDMKIDGNTTLDENLADWMGALMAFEAYRNLSSQVSPRPPKTNYARALNELTEEQMFFMSYANAHCSSESEKSIEDVFSGSTSPRKYRVNVPLKQMDQFAEAFDCDWGSSMNPYTKCDHH